MPETGGIVLNSNVREIRVKRYRLLADELGINILNVASSCEAFNIEFGINWLKNLATYGLPQTETAFLFVAGVSDSDFIACPMRLDHKSGQAHALTTFYSSLYRPLVNSLHCRELLSALFTHLSTVERISSITLAPLDKDAEIFSEIQGALRRAGWRGMHSYFCFGNWYRPITEPSYEILFETLPSRLRNTIRRKHRKFTQNGRGSLRIFSEPNETEEAIALYQSVYDNSWKKPEPFPLFVPKLIELAARHGWLRLGIAFYDGTPIAAQLLLVSGHSASIFKLAYDKAFKHLSPGTLLTAHMIEHVVERDNIKVVDYLTGDDEYKRDWMTQRRERWGIAAYNPNNVRGFLSLCGHTMKSLAKKMTGHSG